MKLSLTKPAPSPAPGSAPRSRTAPPSKSIRALCGAALVAMLVAGPIEASICTGGNNPYGGCFLKLRSYPGEYPMGVTVVGSESKVVVCDLYSGLFYKFNQANIENMTGPFFSPLGVAAYTGLAWHPTEDKLYWIAENATGAKLVRSTLGGILEASFDLTVPNNGALGALTWNPQTASFWTVDYENDVYLELNADGTFGTGSFPSPGLTQFGGEAYGLGLTTVPDPFVPDTYRLDVAVGSPQDLRTSRVLRVETDGSEYGLYYDLGAANEATGWITGIAYADSGSNGAGNGVTFLLDLTNNRIIETPTDDPNARAILDLNCTANVDNDVTLTWTNPNPYNTIQVYRDGVLIDTLGGSATTFTDFDVESAEFQYGLQPTLANMIPMPRARCGIVVGFGRGLNAAPHGGEDPFAITVIESTNQVLVSDLSTGTAYLYGKDLTPAGTISNPFPSGQTSGVAWNSTDNSLLWLESETGALQKTDLTGMPMGASATLSPMPVGLIGDIAYSPLTDTYFGVDFVLRRYFEFSADGTVVDDCPFPSIGASLAGEGQGITVVDDPSSLIFDVPVGPSSGDRVDRVKRLLDCVHSDLEYGVIPTTLSGSIGGIAWTGSGSTGFSSEYLVGFDTGSIYEVSLDLSGSGDDFQRGDVNVDGTRDISDATFLLLFLFPPNSSSPSCLDAADVNDDGGVDITDVVFSLEYLFSGGVTIADPLTCGPDPTVDSLICNSYNICP